MDETEYLRILAALKLEVNLRRAEDACLEKLARGAKLMDFPKGAYIFSAGDDAQDVHLLESGRVILGRETPSGRVFTSMVAVRGMTLNAVTCFMDRQKFFSARVAEKTCVVAIPRALFRQWVLERPEVAAGVLNTMGDLLEGAYIRILDLIEERAENRILNALSMLCSRIGPDLPLTNTDVAEMTGVSRETAARVISNLQKLNLISKSRGRIRIPDPARLKALSTSPAFIV